MTEVSSRAEPRQCQQCGMTFYDTEGFPEGHYGCRWHNCDAESMEEIKLGFMDDLADPRPSPLLLFAVAAFVIGMISWWVAQHG